MAILEVDLRDKSVVLALGPANAPIGAADVRNVALFCQTSRFAIGEGCKGLRLEYASEPVIGPTKHNNQTIGFIHVDENRALLKANQPRKPVGRAQVLLANELSVDACDFDLKILSYQIGNECLSPPSANGNYGAHNPQAIGHNYTLVVRIETLLNSPDMSCFFSTNGVDICAAIEEFIDDQDARALVLSFERVSYKHNTRELLLNSLGRYILGLARKERFRDCPLVCFLDEAHQFIGRSVGDEQNSVSLDAFGLIAKEGRKYGLTTVIATQRPRDVPQDVLSQLGTLFVHRLTNERDRETIEKACGDLDKSAAAFIPALAQGEAIVVGPELPAPLPLKMTRPEKGQQPESHGPRYQEFWGKVLPLEANALNDEVAVIDPNC